MITKSAEAKRLRSGGFVNLTSAHHRHSRTFFVDIAVGCPRNTKVPTFPVIGQMLRHATGKTCYARVV